MHCQPCVATFCIVSACAQAAALQLTCHQRKPSTQRMREQYSTQLRSQCDRIYTHNNAATHPTAPMTSCLVQTVQLSFGAQPKQGGTCYAITSLRTMSVTLFGLQRPQLTTIPKNNCQIWFCAFRPGLASKPKNTHMRNSTLRFHFVRFAKDLRRKHNSPK